MAVGKKRRLAPIFLTVYYAVSLLVCAAVSNPLIKAVCFMLLLLSMPGILLIRVVQKPQFLNKFR
jgi:hypothetical protein